MKDLPVKRTEDFLAEVEVMDLSRLRDGQFVVVVGTGDPNGWSILPSTLHGPYTFVEMLQEVGSTWAVHQHHTKVIVLDKDVNNGTQMLDANTVDYIECHYNDLIVEEMIASFDPKEFTCQAGMVEDDGKDPRRGKKEESVDAETDELT